MTDLHPTSRWLLGMNARFKVTQLVITWDFAYG